MRQQLQLCILSSSTSRGDTASQDLTQHLLAFLYITVIIKIATRDAAQRTFHIILEQPLENVLCQVKMYPVVDRLTLYFTAHVILHTFSTSRKQTTYIAFWGSVQSTNMPMI